LEGIAVARRRSAWLWVGRVVAVLVLAGLAVYLSKVGLDKADKLGSVLSLLVAVVAVVAPYLLPSPQGGGSRSTQSVVNAVVGGHLTQVRDAHGVQVRAAAATPPPATAHPAPAVGLAPDIPGGQYVNEVWVSGNLTQVDGADGDVTVG
jgi:hypothetical protein